MSLDGLSVEVFLTRLYMPSHVFVYKCLTDCVSMLRAQITGDNAGWIGGVPGQANITPTWLCQPGGGSPCSGPNAISTCPAPALQASLQCPDNSCNAKDVRTCLPACCITARSFFCCLIQYGHGDQETPLVCSSNRSVSCAIGICFFNCADCDLILAECNLPNGLAWS